MTHGDMEENVSGCFFLNTVYWHAAYGNIPSPYPAVSSSTP